MTNVEAWARVSAMFEELWTSIAFGLQTQIYPIPLLFTLGLVWLIYLKRKPESGFWAWAFPARIYRNPSFWIDLKIYFFNFLLRPLRSIPGAAITIGIASFIQGIAANLPSLDLPPNLILLGLILFVFEDSVLYIVHRWHHTISLLWPFHKVHHSAEVMNPVTAFRHHPIYDLIYGLTFAAMRGLLQGILLGFLFQEISVLEIAQVNVFLVFTYLIGANLRHSHIWLRFGDRLEHIFISPALHQVHHSTNPKHFNKNFGDNLAIWDWMGGTLYIPSDDEVIEFGLANGQGEKVEQPFKTLRAALIDPFKESFANLRPRKSKQ